jgi:hypothetical protein
VDAVNGIVLGQRLVITVARGRMRKCRDLATAVWNKVDPADDDATAFGPNEAATRCLPTTADRLLVPRSDGVNRRFSYEPAEVPAIRPPIQSRRPARHPSPPEVRLRPGTRKY